LKEKTPDELPVRVAGVTKKFGNIKAVNNVSFGLEYGECFALLGVSGAGKTTCFKSLTGEIMPTAGEVSINGYDVSTKRGFS
jgi:ABC-type multidrug transport system ATPase subunit